MGQSSYPVILTDLAGARCVVVGGGAVAERKVAGLVEAGARPLVISPALTPALAARRDGGEIEHRARRYLPDDLAGAALVIAASDDRALNLAVAAEARRLGALVNVASDGAAGSFHTVGAVRRGDLLITVSTGGRSPALAALLRAELEERYGPAYAAAVEAAAALRAPGASELPAAQGDLLAWLCAAAGGRQSGDGLVAEALGRAGRLHEEQP